MSIAIFYVRTQILLLSHDKMHQPQNIWSCYNSIHAFWLPPQYMTILRLPCFVLANNRHKLPLCNDAYFWKILYTIKVWLWYSWLEEKKNQLISRWYASYITVIDLKWDVMLISDWLLFYWNERSEFVIENKCIFMRNESHFQICFSNLSFWFDWIPIIHVKSFIINDI